MQLGEGKSPFRAALNGHNSYILLFVHWKWDASLQTISPHCPFVARPGAVKYSLNLRFRETIRTFVPTKYEKSKVHDTRKISLIYNSPISNLINCLLYSSQLNCRRCLVDSWDNIECTPLKLTSASSCNPIEGDAFMSFAAFFYCS